MVLAARQELRAKFLAAGIGITGANGLIAESGTVMLVTNEGNGRLTSSLPPIHVVTTGVEKVLPTAADAVTQMRILARSATAQPITTYTTFISAPAPGHELHVILIDNGRRLMAVQPGLEDALRCIRCGACANVCPAYQVVGGHAFGHVYTGPIGLVTTAFHHGLDAAAGPQSLCVSCGACATVCPVTIPLPQQILEVRRLVEERAPSIPAWRRVAMQLAMRAYASRTLFALGTRIAARLTAPLLVVPVLYVKTVANTDCESGLMTATCTVFPATPGGVTAVISDALCTTTFVASTPPTETKVLPLVWKPVP